MKVDSRVPAALLAVTLAGADCDPRGAWEVAFPTDGVGALSGVFGFAPDDVWVVGGTGDAAEVYRFDGSNWAPAAAPDLPLLVWSHGTGPDDVWLVGVAGGVAHWDGSSYTIHDVETDVDLWGVFAVAPDDVWVVGGDVDAGVPVIRHWDGAAFAAEVVAADQNPAGATALFKVFGVDGRLFAVGQRGLLLERVDGVWVRQPAGPDADQDFVSLWGPSADALVAVGGRGNARIATSDGSTWQTTAPSGVGGLNGVFVAADGATTVCGTGGYLATFDAATGALESAPPPAVTEFHAAWGDDAGSTWVVGGQFREPYTGVALVREE